MLTQNGSYLNILNPEQREAATVISGNNFILAGAGSGKTATLVARVAYMLDSGIDPHNILLLTFTNKAAKEMQNRIMAMVGPAAFDITACTFHSFCARFLHENASLIDYPADFTILDSTDMTDAIALVKQEFLNSAKQRGVAYELKDFPSTRDIAGVYSASVNNCVIPEKILRANPALFSYIPEVLSILQNFTSYKKERALLDYDDLLFYTAFLLRNQEPLRRDMDRKYMYIACDEYQDTNMIQNQILDLLSIDYQNLTVVGDDNQSIYAFRHADIQNILSFEQRHPGCHTVILDTNYRSSQEILDFSNVLMSYATEGIPKTLRGTFCWQKPSLVVLDDCLSEADYILQLIRDGQYRLKDTAVICRSAAQTYLLESRLNMYGIPYNKFGGIKFLEKPVIKDILAFLRLSVNIRDELAWFRVLKLYPGIGKMYAQRISATCVSQNVQAAIKQYAKKAFVVYLKEILDAIQSLHQKSLQGQLQYLIENYYQGVRSRQINMMKTSDGNKSDSLSQLTSELEDAKNLLFMAARYRSTSSFLSDLVLDATLTQPEQEDALNITTIHSAKGLEYERVILMDCIEGVTPRCEAGTDEDAEELRCMYVAVTRAKKDLHLLVPRFYSMRSRAGFLSHFLDHDSVLYACRLYILGKEYNDVHRFRFYSLVC